MPERNKIPPPTLLEHPQEAWLARRLPNLSPWLSLTGAPRSGKRSLVRQAAARAGVRLLEFDWSGITDARDLLPLLGEQVHRSAQRWPEGKLRRSALRVARAAGLRLPSIFGQRAARSRGAPTNLFAVTEPLCGLFRAINTDSDLSRQIVVFFSSTGELARGPQPGFVRARLRAELQLLGNVRVVFAERADDFDAQFDLFHGPNAPFYKQMEAVTLEPFQRESLVDWVLEWSQRAEVSLETEAAGWLVDVCRGVVGDLRGVTEELLARAVEGGPLGRDELRAGFDEMTSARAPQFETLCQRLSPPHRVVIGQLRSYESSAFPESTAFCEPLAVRCGYSTEVVVEALMRFRRDHLTAWDRHQGLYIDDPFLRYYLENPHLRGGTRGN
jgi:hypothetical protein